MRAGVADPEPPAPRLCDNLPAGEMGLLGKIFGRDRPPPPPPRDVAALLAPHGTPAVGLLRSDSPSRSHLGGAPALPPGVEWPSRDGRRLGLLARVDLAELRRELILDWLPPAGDLLFFYDLEEQPWGFDPEHRSGWEVLHLPEAGGAPGEPAAGAPGALPRSDLGLRRITSYPSPERAAVEALALTEAEEELLFELIDRDFGDAPQHQMGGFPKPVQSDEMELTCQLVSHGLYCGDPSGYQDPRAAELEAGAADWRLLLQFDSDDDLGVMWGDCGMLYFWVREQDARAGDFSRVWMELQCF